MSKIYSTDREVLTVQFGQMVRSEWWIWLAAFTLTFGIAWYSISVAILCIVIQIFVFVVNNYIKTQPNTSLSRIVSLTTLNSVAVLIALLLN